MGVLGGFGGWGCDGEGREEVGEEENSGAYVEGMRTEMFCPGSSGIRGLFAKRIFYFPHNELDEKQDTLAAQRRRGELMCLMDDSCVY